MPGKKKLLNIRISPELKRAAKKLAVEDGRSLSNWVTHLIELEVKKSDKTCDGVSVSKTDFNSSRSAQ